MAPGYARSIFARSLLAGAACFAFFLVAKGDPTSNAGIAVLETPRVGHAFVTGPVTAFAQSSDGLLFVGSNRLATFDGYAWRSIDIPGGYGFRALTPTKDGKRIWLGAGGIIGYLEKDSRGEWVFFSLNVEAAKVGITDIGEIREIKLYGDRVVFVSRIKILRWTPTKGASESTSPVTVAGRMPSRETGGVLKGTFETWDLPGPRRLYTFSDHEDLYAYQSGVGLVRMDENGPTLVLAEKTLPADAPMAGYYSNPDGSKIAIFANEIYRYDRGNWIHLVEASDAVRGKRALRSERWGNDLIAIGTGFGGVLFMGTDGSVRHVLNLRSGLPDDNVDKLWVDDAGRLWIGTWTSLSHLSDLKTASLYDQRVGFHSFVIRKVLEHNGHIDAITSVGAYRLTASEKMGLAQFGRYEAYFRILRDALNLDGQLWFGSGDGLWKEVENKAVREPEVTSDIMFLAQPKTMRQGVLIFDIDHCEGWLPDAQGKWSLIDLHQPLSGVPTSLLEDDQGKVWISTTDGQVRCFDWDESEHALRLVSHYEPGHGLSVSSARPILSELAGKVLAFTDAATLVLDPGRGEFVIEKALSDYTIVTAANPVKTQPGYWIVQRKEFGTLGPPALVRAEIAKDTHAFILTPLFVPGLDQIGDIVDLSFTSKDAKDELWVGGSQALLRLDVSRLHVADEVPSVVLRRLQIDEEDVAVPSNGNAHTVFSPQMKRLEFAFGPAKIIANDSLAYFQTKLEGVERAWSQPGEQNKREFTGLAPGSYTFRVRALDRFGRTGPEIKYGFVVEAPWYRRPSALALYAATMAVVLWFGVRWRFRRLRLQAERLEQLVNARTRELSLSNTAKSEFLENISHEIRNPLNGVVGLIAMLEESGLSGRQYAHAQALKECSESLTRVFNEVLNFSKLEYGYVAVEERAFSLRALLDSVLAVFMATAVQQKNSFAVHLPSEYVEGFWGDEAKIKTIVTNFVGNALKYAPGTPVEITISSANRSDDKVDVLIEVKDGGPGVPADEQELIFKKFVRGSQASAKQIVGSGIGLATSRVMAQLLGGNVGIESELGKGATFFLKLVLGRHKVPVPDEPATEATATGGAWALIVEDQHYNQVVLASLVAKLGYQTESADNAEQALLAFANKTFGVVFLDVELPGIKGPEIARRLRALPRGNEPIIIGASANDSRESETRCLAAGMDAFLVKPLAADAIRGVLAEVALRREIAKQNREPEAIDYTSLELYARNIPGGMHGATKTYVALLQGELESLRFAVEGDSAEAIWQAAHKVRSHGTLIGAAKLCALAGEMERAAREGQLEARLTWWSKISAEAEILQGRLMAKTLV